MIKESKIFVIINKEIRGEYIATYGLGTIKIDPFVTDYYEDENYPHFEVEKDFDADPNFNYRMCIEGQKAILKGIWSSDDWEQDRVFLVNHMELVD